MTTAGQLTRLRELRKAIENAQARVRRFTEMRDELIADMLIEQAATGCAIGAAAGVTQPRVVQIRNAVVLRRETAAAEAAAAEAAAKEARRAKRRRKVNTQLVEAS